MTQLLAKLFVKDYENIGSAKVRTSYGVVSSIVGVICNIILFGMKLAIGLIINSISVTADAFNNLSDAGASIISFIGVKLAEKPADKEHPFGHGRSEYISALIIAFLILQVGITLFKDSFNKILHLEEIGFSLISILILGTSILLKLWLSVFNRKLGNRINSSIMKATSAGSLSDVIVTSATDRNVYEKITNKVESYEGILGSHDLIVHNYGPSHTMAIIMQKYQIMKIWKKYMK